jgi:branched-chain amino acid transport system ATP-binding protein
VAKAGIARTFQNIRLFGEMTALENVMVGRHVRSKQGVLARFSATRPRDEEASIRRARRNCWILSALASLPIARPNSCPTAISAVWKSPARWRPIRNCWRWTNRLPA